MKKLCSNWSVLWITVLLFQLFLWLYTAIVHKSIDISYKNNSHIVFYEQEPKLFLLLGGVSIIGILYFIYLTTEFIKCKRSLK